MKNLKIIALVLAAHVAGLCVLLTVQGCRSTTASAESVAAASEVAPAPVAPVAWADAPAFQPIAVNVPAAPSPAMPPPDRFAPTRPGSAAAAEALPAQNYVVKKNDTLGAIARRHGVTKDELARANNLGASSILKIGQSLVIPSPKAAGSTNGAAATSGGPTYKVRSGDTLGGIARRHGVPLGALRAANGMTNDNIGVGQELRIPVTESSAAAGRASSTAGGTVSQTGSESVSLPATGGDSRAKSSVATTNRGAGRHTVAPGETIDSLSKRYKVSQVAIMTANNITNPKSVRAGQELIIPGAAGVAAPPQPAIEAESSPATMVPAGDPPPVQPAGGGDTPVQPVIEEAPPVVPVQ